MAFCNGTLIVTVSEQMREEIQNIVEELGDHAEEALVLLMAIFAHISGRA